MITLLVAIVCNSSFARIEDHHRENAPLVYLTNTAEKDVFLGDCSSVALAIDTSGCPTKAIT